MTQHRKSEKELKRSGVNSLSIYSNYNEDYNPIIAFCQDGRHILLLGLCAGLILGAL